MTRQLASFCAVALLSALSACTGDSGDGGDTPTDTTVDLRTEFPAAPENGQQWLSPVLTIPAKTEQQWCYIARYDGEDVGIHSAVHYQSQYGHHVLFMSTTADEETYPDGSMFDCTSLGDNFMLELEPIYFAKLEGATSSMMLPDGMAVKLRQGKRIIIQSHYVNTSDTPIMVQDAINLEYMDPDTVTTWAAPFANAIVDFSLPANQETTLTLSCTWDYDVSVLFLQGHMHEMGTAFSLTDTTEGGTSLIYEVTPWAPEYRDTPPIYEWQAGEFNAKIGDTFTTSCTWYNNTDQAVSFPAEMCATAGMAYPATAPIICSN